MLSSILSSYSNFDKLFEKATSSFLVEPAWADNIKITDMIRQNEVPPKYVLNAIKKKLQLSINPYEALFTLTVLETIVKNCGSIIHNEMATKETCEWLCDVAKKATDEKVRNKILELIQAWAWAFRKQSKYQAITDIMNILKAEGYKFPQLNESEAMFISDTAPEWSDGDVCTRCRTEFTFLQRKHHCRACGKVFCHQCSSHEITIPKYGIEKEVRVCDTCYDKLSNKTSSKSTHDKHNPLLSSPNKSVSTGLDESKTPSALVGGKTSEELLEEEELNLAIAISQSEAEEKEKEKKRLTSSAFGSRNGTASPKAHSGEENINPELAHYLNRSYWEQKQNSNISSSTPSAPKQTENVKIQNCTQLNGGSSNKSTELNSTEMEEFVQALKSQVEIFVNRMKSNSSRGRSIANDSSVQTLFLNITQMHSKLLLYIQNQDDARLKYEALQDKLSQIKDARAALDALRDEYRERLRREAEDAERQRQMQMAQKLDVMRKKKQDYLQYQRQLALQKIQDQEREMQMRQEMQKHQYNAVMHQQLGGGIPPQQYDYIPGGGIPPVIGMIPPPIQYQIPTGPLPQQIPNAGIPSGPPQAIPPGGQTDSTKLIQSYSDNQNFLNQNTPQIMNPGGHFPQSIPTQMIHHPGNIQQQLASPPNQGPVTLTRMGVPNQNQNLPPPGVMNQNQNLPPPGVMNQNQNLPPPGVMNQNQGVPSTVVPQTPGLPPGVGNQGMPPGFANQTAGNHQNMPPSGVNQGGPVANENNDQPKVEETAELISFD